jgi:hypothetical protein
VSERHVTKPFGIGELLARIRAALRHLARREQGGATLKLGEVEIDLARRRVLAPGRDIHLTPIEFRLLACLARHEGMVVTHRHLLREVWGPTHVEQPQYLRVYMKQLRQKLEPDPVQPRYLLDAGDDGAEGRHEIEAGGHQHEAQSDHAHEVEEDEAEHRDDDLAGEDGGADLHRTDQRRMDQARQFAARLLGNGDGADHLDAAAGGAGTHREA